MKGASLSIDHGYGDESSPSVTNNGSKVNYQPSDQTDYGYGSQDDYGYGEDQGPSCKAVSAPMDKARRPMRRNSCLIKKDQNPLAVAEFLLGPPRCPDNELDADEELLF